MATSRKGSRSAAPVRLVSADAVINALRLRYEAPAWVMFENVANGTGSRADRWADALAMSVWPSRGLVLLGFEVKITRQGVLRELQNPRKADAVGSYCDFWWLAVGSEDIAKPDEIPPAWGLLAPVLNNGKTTMRVLKEATKLDAKPLDRGFLAAILRRAHERFDVNELRRNVRAEIYNEVSEQVHTNTGQQHEYEITQLRTRAETAEKEAEKARAQLRDALGSGYSPHVFHAAVDLLGRLSGWRSAESALSHMLLQYELLDQSKKALQDALAIVHMLTGKAPVETEVTDGG